MSSAVEVPIADLGQRSTDFYIGFQTLPRYRFKSIEIFDFGRGQVTFRVRGLFGSSCCSSDLVPASRRLAMRGARAGSGSLSCALPIAG